MSGPASTSAPLKRPRSPVSAAATDNRTKKLKLLAEHAAASPFPDFLHPTIEEAYDVHRVLATAHPDITTTHRAPSEGSNSAKTCGSVPNVLESLIGTILSQNTSGKNSTAAKRSLDAAFGRNNFEAIAKADKAEVVEAIRHGGLANKKAGVIQTILRDVHAKYGEYSLQHLAGVPVSPKDEKNPEDKTLRKAVSNEDAMAELVSFEGVGPKTASCVLMFCLGRYSFPVDTHVFRLTRLLGWVPQKADRVTAQAHLDIVLPGELKYGLHVLMVGHGRRCKGCKNASSSKAACVLKDWLKDRKGLTKQEVQEAVLESDVKASEST
ncbi:DNA glycosylase [Cristinia sonorae]|uniref:DNA glycosylase n=1 Tax=Cristinia sonorae TaxID=1940300 RepID=A0A8K0UEV3_9AGAR|nr:DNA glycosylase [Cristinia sonorae]